MKWLFLIFLSCKVFAQSGNDVIASPKGVYRIDGNYLAGKYLIYDCEKKHYACVDSDGNSRCKELRSDAIASKAQIYPCAPLSAYADKKSCVEKNYKFIESNANKRFCYPK